MDPIRIFHPVLFLVGLTYVVLLRIPLVRIRAARERRVSADDFKLGESPAVPPDVALPNRNYMNLLELPLLFYVLAISLFVTQRLDGAQLTMAWIYVSLRAAHSLVHLTYNNVLHRLSFFALSNVVLSLMWLHFAQSPPVNSIAWSRIRGAIRHRFLRSVLTYRKYVPRGARNRRRLAPRIRLQATLFRPSTPRGLLGGEKVPRRAGMPRAHKLLDRVDTPEGPLELRQSGERSFMITIAGRVLMTSQLTRSEVAVAELACSAIGKRPAPRVLIGGLGLGFTLRAALDALPAKARVEIAELNPAVERWCRGPLAVLTHDALADPRVEVHLGDVTRRIRAASGRPRYDAIILDLYLGPADLPRGQSDPLYGTEILQQTASALTQGGVYSVWSEEPNLRFEARLRKIGFDVELVRPRGGGPRHAVYVAVKR